MTRTACWIVLIVGALRGFCEEQTAVGLPAGVRAVWDLTSAWRETTPTRERACVNGLWRWRPAAGNEEAVPAGGWGYFKVPGNWPGISDYLQKDSQTVYAHPAWKDQKLTAVSAAWYQREVEIPREWAGRRVTLSIEYLNSLARVYVDGKKVGEARYPGGEMDLSAACKPGAKHVLSILVTAMPLKGVMLSYADTATAKEVKGTVARRGLCGDVYLASSPSAARIGDVRVETSVRLGEVKMDIGLAGLVAAGKYSLRAAILQGGRRVKEFASTTFGPGDLVEGRWSFSEKWKPESLWDLNSPGNVYELEVALVDWDRKVVDTAWRERFGFREFWIDGRDFYLNGSRVFLSAVPIDNAEIGASMANYAAARETMARLKKIGINFVYTHNYGCEPGTHLSFTELLRAADDVGMLVGFSQPHFSQYEWQAADADEKNGYARHAAFYVRAAQNHPSVVCYSMSHNATGYDQDMNPDLIDGLRDPRNDQWSSRNAKWALRAEAIVRRLDPSRIVYHHAGGNIGAMHTINFYPNFAPIQELSDWYGHWASAGVKPAFMCEYGAPFAWDWTMYRGWYQGKREFGSAVVPWEFCLAEWNAQFLGDRAFASGEREGANLRWEAKQFAAGKVWHRWDYPTEVGSARFEDRNEILAAYLTDNWRAYRTWGVSGISPWEYGMFWIARDGVDRARKELKVDWERLQRPGISADYVERPMERIDTAFEFADWIPTAAGRELLRNNQPVLAYIGGGAPAFTEKDHDYRAGQTVEKQLIAINNSRATLTFACEWSLGLSPAIRGQKDVSVETGQQARIPLRFELPAELGAGAYDLRADVKYGEEQTQSDVFVIHVLPALATPIAPAKLAVFDPHGETAGLLEKLGVKFRRLEGDADLGADETLIVGKLALSVDGPAPDISRVRDGLRVILFEQTSQVLEKRLGFRVAEYGLRRVFARMPDHPVLAGIGAEQLRDWRGEATTLPPRLTFETRPRHGPTVRWCDIPVDHVWRCGNRGNVASVLIEKPARGDFRPIADGGFDLQYSPLMEYREGKGMVMFCQLDVTGRSETEPAAEILVGNLLKYVADFKAGANRAGVYVGDEAGRAHLETAGIHAAAYDGGKLSLEQVLVVGPGGGEKLKSSAAGVADFLKAGGHVVAIGLGQSEVDAFSPVKVVMKKGEHITATFEPAVMRSPLAGIAPADVYNRAPREIPLVEDGGASRVGNGVLGLAPGGDGDSGVVFCQLVPWQLDYKQNYGLKRTYRRASFALTRILANLGVAGRTPLLERVHTPVGAGEKRWLEGVYLDAPEEWDDPYRFFRW